MSPSPSPARRFRVDRVLYGGDGLARPADPTDPVDPAESQGSVLVPFTLPGEWVEVDHAQSESQGMRVLEPSPERVAPGCPYFGVCGGCHLQMASYPEQLRIKQTVLEDALARAGVRHWPGIVIQAAEPWGYRNRIRLRVEPVDGVLRFSYVRRGHQQVFLPIRTCPIAAPVLWHAAETMLALAAVDRDFEDCLRAAREVELFTSEDLARLQISLLCSTGAMLKPQTFASAGAALSRELGKESSRELGRPPGSEAGRDLSQNSSLDSRQAFSGVAQLAGMGAIETTWQPLRLGRMLASWGASGLNYRVDSAGLAESYWVTRGGFFQVNRFLLPTLVDLVCAGRSGSVPGTLAWDLFAGVGLFSRVLARSFARVTAVEANPQAAGELKSSLGRLGPGHTAEAATTLAFLRRAVTQRERPELIVLDPPRAGAGREVCELLRRIAAPEIVYVSCDPVTLARDLGVLQADYDLAALALVDLFPQTYHQEAVVTLRRRG